MQRHPITLNLLKMSSELVIDVQATEISIALLEEKRLIELNKESKVSKFSVGDIYLAKVKKLMPGVNAAFVDVGYEKSAFLHYPDLGPKFRSFEKLVKDVRQGRKGGFDLSKYPIEKDIEKGGHIADVLTQGQEVLVQVAKEPISTKGPRLTSEISIAGRFLVLIPFADKIYVSQKIKSEGERNRIKKLLRDLKPKNFGVIVRTVGEGKKAEDFEAELNSLLSRWNESIKKISHDSKLPLLLFEEMGRAVSILRDIFNPSFESIYVNDEVVYHEICDYVGIIAPERKENVKLYTEDVPIFDHFAVTKQLKSSFGRTVSFKSGSYLIIEKTEAMHVVDVNSGNRSKAGNDQEANALEVNLAAADELARQLRLRDLGGIIVVDFIDMVKAENRQALFARMRENMQNDRAKHNILQLSKFGLMQITRQRVRPEMHIDTEEVCPTCLGKGFSRPSILFVDELENKIDYLVNTLKVKEFKLFVHPYVDAYINKGFPFFTLKWKWKRKYKASFKIIPSQNLSYLQYRFLDADANEIDLKEEIETVSQK
jgi:ribonuclease G